MFVRVRPAICQDVGSGSDSGESCLGDYLDVGAYLDDREREAEQEADRDVRPPVPPPAPPPLHDPPPVAGAEAPGLAGAGVVGAVLAAGAAAPAAAGAAAPARGWGRRRGVDAYQFAIVPDEHGDELGRILINLHERSQSLDAHCRRCACRVNRKYKPHGRLGDRHHQGRPMGSLVAWLRQPCDGDADTHSRLYALLTHAERSRARVWAEGLGTFADHFSCERAQRLPGEELEPWEIA